MSGTSKKGPEYVPNRREVLAAGAGAVLAVIPGSGTLARPSGEPRGELRVVPEDGIKNTIAAEIRSKEYGELREHFLGSLETFLKSGEPLSRRELDAIVYDFLRESVRVAPLEIDIDSDYLKIGHVPSYGNWILTDVLQNLHAAGRSGELVYELIVRLLSERMADDDAKEAFSAKKQKPEYENLRENFLRAMGNHSRRISSPQNIERTVDDFLGEILAATSLSRLNSFLPNYLQNRGNSILVSVLKDLYKELSKSKEEHHSNEERHLRNSAAYRLLLRVLEERTFLQFRKDIPGIDRGR